MSKKTEGAVENAVSSGRWRQGALRRVGGNAPAPQNTPEEARRTSPTPCLASASLSPGLLDLTARYFNPQLSTG